MQRQACEKSIRALVHRWTCYRRAIKTPERIFSVYDFFRWLRDFYPQLTRFRTVKTVMDDIESWFNDELERAWAH